MNTVAGQCPRGCGRTLFLGASGHVTCSFIDCPDPGAADALLASPPDAHRRRQEAARAAARDLRRAAKLLSEVAA